MLLPFMANIGMPHRNWCYWFVEVIDTWMWWVLLIWAITLKSAKVAKTWMFERVMPKKLKKKLKTNENHYAWIAPWHWPASEIQSGQGVWCFEYGWLSAANGRDSPCLTKLAQCWKTGNVRARNTVMHCPKRKQEFPRNVVMQRLVWLSLFMAFYAFFCGLQLVLNGLASGLANTR